MLEVAIALVAMHSDMFQCLNELYLQGKIRKKRTVVLAEIFDVNNSVFNLSQGKKGVVDNVWFVTAVYLKNLKMFSQKYTSQLLNIFLLQVHNMASKNL